MIKFFRRIRQRLLTENKLSKYLLYAIGEIVLVVIGILIALQINNANEQRKLDNQEQNYLVALLEEFKYNKQQLELVMEENQQYGQAAREVLKHTGPNPSGITEAEFSVLFLSMINGEVQYRPSNGVLEEIISSGKLALFKNEDLKNYLASWGGVLFKVRFQEQEQGILRLDLINLGHKNANIRNIFMQSFDTFDQIGESKFIKSSLDLLKVREFENQTMAFLATSYYSNKNYYTDLKEKIDAILSIIDSQLE